MRKITCFTLGFVLFTQLSFSQDFNKYVEFIGEAWKLYQTKDFLKSAQTYSKAFDAWGGEGAVDDRYNAACSWALANHADSAFVQLFKITQHGSYDNLGHISTDPDLNSLYADSRWAQIIGFVKSNKEKFEANFDKPLVALLDSIYVEDQKYRKQLPDIEASFGRKSPELKAHWELIDQKDSLNLVQVERILDERGWLGKDVIGHQGNLTLFLVVQHADLKTQEKYLPMMREAVKKNNAEPSSLALLEDRVALRKGGKQIYGSQVTQDGETGEHYVMPLEDPDHVDKRRAEVGLGTIQEYISNWGMTWNAEDYKKKLPGYIAKQKKW